MEIIVAATKSASEVLGLSDSIGTIENNKIADIIVVNSNLLMDFKCLTNIELVIKDGKIVKNKLSV